MDCDAGSSGVAPKWSSGDLVLAQIGKYPHWPSIIIENNIKKKEGKSSIIHKVRFFNDNKRVAWISEKNLLLLENKNDYRMRLNAVQQKKCNERWEKAFEEANRIVEGDESFLQVMLSECPPQKKRIEKKNPKKSIVFWLKFCKFVDCQKSLGKGTTNDEEFIQDACQKWQFARTKRLRALQELNQDLGEPQWDPAFNLPFYQEAMKALLKMAEPDDLPPIPPS